MPATATADTALPITRQRLFTKMELAKFLSVTVRQIDHLMTRSQFPRPYRSGSAPRWAEGDIEAWLEAGRDPEISKE